MTGNAKKKEFIFWLVLGPGKYARDEMIFLVLMGTEASVRIVTLHIAVLSQTSSIKHKQKTIFFMFFLLVVE